MIRLLVMLAACTLLPISAFASCAVPTGTLWYVKSGGGGSNNGTSWTNAWTAFASISWAGMTAGDTLFIDGGASGVTYTTSLTVGKSGTAGNLITVCPGQDASHNGVVTFDGGGATTSTTPFVSAGGQDYVTISGEYQGSRHLAVTNFYNSSLTSPDQGRCTGGSGGNDHLRFEYLTLDNCGNGVYISVPTFAYVGYSAFSNIRGDAAIGLVLNDGSASVYDRTVVEYNSLDLLCRVGTNYQTVDADRCGIDDNHGGPDGIQSGRSITIRYNTFTVTPTTTTATSNQHMDYVQAQGGYTKFYGNTITNVGDSVLDFDFSTGSAHAKDNVQIYNNVFRILSRVDWYPEFIRVYNGSPSTCSNWLIANNVFADTDESIYAIQWAQSSCTVSSSKFTNNLFINVGNGTATGGGRGPIIEITSANDGWTFDHNVYYRAGGGSLINYRGTGYTCAGFITLKDATGSCSVPTFTSYSFHSASNDFTLQSGDTVAKDTGFDLSGTFTIDKTGATRTGTWDRGAFEFVGSPPSTTPGLPKAIPRRLHGDLGRGVDPSRPYVPARIQAKR